ncbi:MAG: response regulator transcription factor [Candidatus Sericytochromatia bacterium]|nr:response regulator transcription factor [Candidatus Sericytochromatia bacterium]
MRILIVEDETKMADLLARSLREEGFAADVAGDGPQGEDLALTQDYDAIVLDRMLPGKDGLAVCRSLREHGLRTPVRLLTAKDAVADRVDGLNAGADDYLAKPFAFEELLARLRALLRRHGDKSPILRLADLALDPIRREVRRAGQPIHLTRREYALLEYLLRQTGNVLDRQTLLEHVWDDFEAVEGNIVDVYINYLRQKIDKGFSPKLIQTVRGTGYVLKADDG